MIMTNNLTRINQLKAELEKNNLMLLGQGILSIKQTQLIIEKIEEILSLVNSNSSILNLIEHRQLLLHQGNAYLELNKYELALNDYKKVKTLISDEEKDFDLHKLKCLDGISWCLARIGRYSEALAQCNELIAYAYQKDQLINKFFTVRAVCYREMGEDILEQRSFEIANRRSMQLKEFLYVEGDESLLTGFTEYGFKDLGNKCFDRKRYADALKYYDKAIKYNPKFAEGYFNIGVVHAVCENHNLAIMAYTQCINISPNYSAAYLNRGNEYFHIGKDINARNDYYSCLKIDPSNSDARDNLNILRSVL
jgi:tetratricopeptide (TPR) repeat protein